MNKQERNQDKQNERKAYAMQTQIYKRNHCQAMAQFYPQSADMLLRLAEEATQRINALKAQIS